MSQPAQAIPQDRITAFLKQCKSKDKNLYDHLCEMLSKMPTDQLNGYIHFERISEYFKRVKFQPLTLGSEEQVRKKLNSVIQYPYWLALEQSAIEQAKKIIKNEHKLQQNIQKATQSLFEPIGISFGPDITYKLNTVIKLIAEKENAVSIRFWGKIMGTQSDYYILQGIADKKKQPIVKGDTEKYKEGVNYYSYWVCDSVISDDWYELPLVSPQQIVASRLMKYAFTGNLEANIRGYPGFPGKEKHLLKCQLVRITHNCEIVPNGLYSLGGEENPDKLQFSEEFKMPEFNDLANLQNWVHLNPYILNLGRADYYKDPSLTPEQQDELLAKIQQNPADQKIDRLKGINQDKPIQKLGMQGCWVSKQTGNLQTFTNVGKQQGTIACYGHVVLKNPHWPGWTTVANAKSFASIYIGYGSKLTQDAFSPLSPEDLCVEGQDIDEFDEPNPSNPPDELQPDSDDENKKPEDQ